jgi:hypothetical protein
MATPGDFTRDCGLGTVSATSDYSYHTRVFVRLEVLNGERAVDLVSDDAGDLMFLCGLGHPDDADHYRAVGLGHVLDADPRLREVPDLEPGLYAERETPESEWVRSPIGD